jgi:hypothetical protein
MSPAYQPRLLCLGTATDAYQPIERKLGITRALIEVLAEFRHPFSLITKSAGVERDLDLLAPLAAQVEDSYYRVGEWVPAGSPVLSLLAPAAVKARFWVAEADLPKAQPGSQVTLRCDGCGAPMPATIRFLARNAEYTPPLIYSRDNRAKLVWMAEALPSAADAARLRPGQPLDVTLGSGS